MTDLSVRWGRGGGGGGGILTNGAGLVMGDDFEMGEGVDTPLRTMPVVIQIYCYNSKKLL